MQWLQRNYLTELEYDARYAMEKSNNLIGFRLGPFSRSMVGLSALHSFAWILLLLKLYSIG